MKEKFPLRVLSYNIHKGFGPGKRLFTLRKIKEIIRTVHPDVVFLQEIVGEHKRHARRIVDWPQVSQFEFLADELWPHFAYGQNAVYSAGHHGNAILSKYPIVGYSNFDISRGRYDRRGFLHAIMETPKTGEIFHCICTHLALIGRHQKLQTMDICKRLASTTHHSEPLIVAGDFNDWRGKLTKEFTKSLGVHEIFHHSRGRHARTFPSRFPVLPLDRIYCRGMEARTLQVLSGKPWSTLSDHAALFAVLEM